VELSVSVLASHRDLECLASSLSAAVCLACAGYLVLAEGRSSHRLLSSVRREILKRTSTYPAEDGVSSQEQRTKSTTGVPRRQIVIVSPFSAALISSGSLFFASATLTRMTKIMAIADGHVYQ